MVEAKTLWVLGLPLLLTELVVVVLLFLSPSITVGFSLDHRLVWLGLLSISFNLLDYLNI